MQKALARFWRFVWKTDGCWFWIGGTNKNKKRGSAGYGKFKFEGRCVPAHRFLYESIHGKITDDSELDHLCRNRLCVRQDHLELVPPKVNTLRGRGPTALNSQKQSCVRGHPFDEGNTYVTKLGSRQCRICCRARQLERVARKRGMQRDAASHGLFSHSQEPQQSA